MITIKDVYVAYRQAQATYHNRGWRMPKDFNKWLEKHPKEKEALELAKNLFNTKWSNIDLHSFMKYGFELWKGGFTYNRFFNKKIIKYYIDRDKLEKRQLEIDKETVKKSIDYIKKYCNNHSLSIKEYCNIKDGYKSQIVDDYIKNNVDKFTLIYFIIENYFTLNDNERALMPQISDIYRKNVNCVLKMKGYFKEVLNDT